MSRKYEDRLLAAIDVEQRRIPWERRPIVVRTVWCLRCACRFKWAPSIDGNAHACGHPLSLYGPFEEAPTLCPTPRPLPPRWRT